MTFLRSVIIASATATAAFGSALHASDGGDPRNREVLSALTRGFAEGRLNDQKNGKVIVQDIVSEKMVCGWIVDRVAGGSHSLARLFLFIPESRTLILFHYSEAESSLWTNLMVVNGCAREGYLASPSPTGKYADELLSKLSNDTR